MDLDSPIRCSPDDFGPRKTDDTSSTNLHHVLIKWTESKRRLAKQIVCQFPCRESVYRYVQAFISIKKPIKLLRKTSA
jgi:hypothetical protein